MKKEVKQITKKELTIKYTEYCVRNGFDITDCLYNRSVLESHRMLNAINNEDEFYHYQMRNNFIK